MPAVCTTSTFKELIPVRNDDILADAENAPSFDLLKACTHGNESVQCCVIELLSRMNGAKCSVTSFMPSVRVCYNI